MNTINQLTLYLLPICLILTFLGVKYVIYMEEKADKEKEERRAAREREGFQTTAFSDVYVCHCCGAFVKSELMDNHSYNHNQSKKAGF